MQNVQENIKAANEARTKVENHCMAYNVKEDANHLTVIFPLGYQLDGVRVSMANGKLWAYTKALEKMEWAWNQNMLA